MLSGPLVFLDIDTQRDFLDPAGSLFLPGSAVILPNLARLSAFARSQQIPVIASACAHEIDEQDPEPFPPHCLVGTPGEERIEATSWPRSESVVLGPEDRFDALEPPPPHLTLKKRRYDFFSHPEADRIIKLYSKNDPTFVVYGVATDYCVECAVLGLRERGQQVALVIDAIRPVDLNAEPERLAEFVRQGVTLIRTDAVCQDQE